MSTGQRIADDVYWRQEHETAGKFRFDRLAELINEAVEAEREACAQTAAVAKRSVDAPKHGAWDRGYEDGRNDAAAAIRRRSTLSE